MKTKLTTNQKIKERHCAGLTKNTPSSLFGSNTLTVQQENIKQGGLYFDRKTTFLPLPSKNDIFPLSRQVHRYVGTPNAPSFYWFSKNFEFTVFHLFKFSFSIYLFSFPTFFCIVPPFSIPLFYTPPLPNDIANFPQNLFSLIEQCST